MTDRYGLIAIITGQDDGLIQKDSSTTASLLQPREMNTGQNLSQTDQTIPIGKTQRDPARWASLLLHRFSSSPDTLRHFAHGI